MPNLDPYSHHEALDRTHIQLLNLEHALGEHPVINGDQAAKALYDKAVEALAALYQHLGSLTPKDP